VKLPVIEVSLAQLAAAAQHRGGREQRRADGAYFTDDDVAAWLAQRALTGWMSERHGEQWRQPTSAKQAELVLAALSSIRVLDPSVGAGSFLIAAWIELTRAVQSVRAWCEQEQFRVPVRAGRITPSQLIGIDCDAGALAACRASLEFVCGSSAVEALLIRSDARDALDGNGLGIQADLVLGNPPFVRERLADAPAGLVTARVPNRSAWIVERALDAAAPGACVSFVLPISTSCVSAFEPARELWNARCSHVTTTHFDCVPSSLFDGVVQRISVFEGRVRAADEDRETTPSAWLTSRYHRWRASERSGLLDRIEHVAVPSHSVGGSIAKIGSQLENDILERVFSHAPAHRLLERPCESNIERTIYYKRRWSYYLLFMNFVPAMWDADGAPREPSEFKRLSTVKAVDSSVMLALYSSTLFWWYFSVFTDNRNVNQRDLAAFGVPDVTDVVANRLADLADELMDSLRASSEIRTCHYRSVGTIRNTYFRQAHTRPVIDKIDRVLAQWYGLTREQLDFILGFEARFRRGVPQPNAV
jgi:hypothetical protein